MRTIGLLSMALLAAGSVAMQAANIKGNGKIVKKTITLEQYDQVYMQSVQSSSSFFSWGKSSLRPVFHYKQGKDSQLVITTDENVYPYLKIQVKKGILTIKTDKSDRIEPTQLVIEGSSETLKQVAVGCGAHFIFENDFAAESLSCTVGGGGKIIAENSLRLAKAEFTVGGGGGINIEKLNSSIVDASVGGGGNIELKGTAQKAGFSVGGGGDLKAYELIADHVNASVGGGGDIYVNAKESLNASAGGGGDIYYKGNPKQVKTSIGGGGDVHHVK